MTYWNFPENCGSKIRQEGYYLSPTALSSDAVEAMRLELSQWTNRPAVNGYGCVAHAGDALLQNAALYSKTALAMALDPAIVAVLSENLGAEIRLSKIEHRRVCSTKPELPLHCDGGDDLHVFVYLNGVSSRKGSTFLIPKTHSIGSTKSNGSFLIPIETQREFGGETIIPDGPPGTVLIFDGKTWHGRTPTIEVGREMLWVSYVAKANTNQSVNLVVSSNALAGLTADQLSLLGFGDGVTRHDGEDFCLSKSFSENSLSLVPANALYKAAASRMAKSAYRKLPSGIRRFVARFR